jgi:hypothetical protein
MSLGGAVCGACWPPLTAAFGRPVARSLTDAQRSRLVSSERTQLVELRALGSTGSSAEGALGDGPEPDELVDFGSAVIPGRRTSRPKGLFVADGGSQCPEGHCCAVGSVTSCGEAGCSSARRRRPGLSLGFPRVPFCSLRLLSRLLGGGTSRAGCGVPAGQRPVALVGVTGFEPAASSSRTGDHSALPCC